MALHTGYQGARSCTSGPQPGARALMAWVLGAYGQLGASNLGIYNCRTVRGGSTTSLHGEGRAIDVGFPIGDPDGNILAEALRLNSKELGIQCIIYERKIWSGSYPNAGWRNYDGVASHNDHLHIELSWDAANTLTAEKIQSVLGGATVPPNSGPAPRPAGRPVKQIGDLLREGDTGPGVKWLIDELNRTGQDAGPNDATFGPRVLAATKRYQLAAFGPDEDDGIAGPKTNGALPRTPTYPGTADARPWQRRLVERGYNIGRTGPERNGVDNDWGTKCVNSLTYFQREKGLTADGKRGPQSWVALFIRPITR